ncbi:hypothetical protein A8M32_23995 [Sinorhizobium alkalisoli]|uniref:Transmembrane protein n=2 Tax=Sinorhizobium alkalisoli TaxID=1752398 RepID=A0A1E3V6U2_9HYPH|nr:hypothetical protein A8M32_23995 [Sinorhizobium alkalisoli]
MVRISAEGATANDELRFYLGVPEMAFSFTERKNRPSDFAFRLLASPLAFAVYVAIAMAIAFLASAGTGIPAYLLVPVGFLLVTFLDPPARLMKLREGRNGQVVKRRLRQITAANNNRPSEFAHTRTKARESRSDSRLR